MISYVFVFFCLTFSFRIMPSKSIHVIANALHVYSFLSSYYSSCTRKILQSCFNLHVSFALGPGLKAPVTKVPLNPTVEAFSPLEAMG